MSKAEDRKRDNGEGVTEIEINIEAVRMKEIELKSLLFTLPLSLSSFPPLYPLQFPPHRRSKVVEEQWNKIVATKYQPVRRYLRSNGRKQSIQHGWTLDSKIIACEYVVKELAKKYKGGSLMYPAQNSSGKGGYEDAIASACTALKLAHAVFKKLGTTSLKRW